MPLMPLWARGLGVALVACLPVDALRAREEAVWEGNGRTLLSTREPPPRARFVVENADAGAVLALFPDPPTPAGICDGGHAHFGWSDAHHAYTTGPLLRDYAVTYHACQLTPLGWTPVAAFPSRVLNARSVPPLALGAALFLALALIYGVPSGSIPLLMGTAALTRLLLVADRCHDATELLALLAAGLVTVAAVRRYPPSVVGVPVWVSALAVAAKAAGLDLLHQECLAQQSLELSGEGAVGLLRYAVLPWGAKAALAHLHPDAPAPVPMVAGLLVLLAGVGLPWAGVPDQTTLAAAAALAVALCLPPWGIKGWRATRGEAATSSAATSAGAEYPESTHAMTTRSYARSSPAPATVLSGKLTKGLLYSPPRGPRPPAHAEAEAEGNGPESPPSPPRSTGSRDPTGPRAVAAAAPTPAYNGAAFPPSSDGTLSPTRHIDATSESDFELRRSARKRAGAPNYIDRPTSKRRSEAAGASGVTSPRSRPSAAKKRSLARPGDEEPPKAPRA